jgi:APA family basic amino acid/polyamine antiporter
MLSQILRRKALPTSISQVPGGLRRSISLFQLTLMGVGSTLGTGIFFALAETVPIAGPAVTLSFVLAGIVAALTALCYAEVSSSLPVSGSSYTFTYMTLGQGAAMLVAACLLLEWGVAGAAVAVGWSSYLNDLVLIVTGYEIPRSIQSAPFDLGAAGIELTGESYFNLPAVVLVWMCALLLLRGSKESALVNSVLTLAKLGVLTMFVILALFVFESKNFQPFMPSGIEGVGAAAAIVFFSFIGLDAVVNASEEAMNPQRNIPLAIVAALVIVTTFYLLIAISSLGVQPASDFHGHDGSLTTILEKATHTPSLSGVLAAGAVISIFSVTLIAIYGQSRIFFAMARDKMVPPILCKLDPKTGSPRHGILFSTAMVTPMAAFAPSHLLWSMVSLGTLVAFMAVAIALMVLRSYHKRESQGYRTPFYPVLPILSILSCLFLMSNLSDTVFKVFGVWLALATLFYIFYSRKNANEDDIHLAES